MKSLTKINLGDKFFIKIFDLLSLNYIRAIGYL